jgi:heptosyltransferase-2
MHAPEKILLIRFSSIGDILLASPLVRALRAKYPEARIDFLTKRKYAELFRANPHLTSVIEFDDGEKEEIGALRRKIRETKYDLILDLHDSLRSKYLRVFSRAKEVRTVNKRAIRRFFLVKLKWNMYGAAVSVADRYLETAKDFGVSPDGQGLEIFIPPDVVQETEEMLKIFLQSRDQFVVGLAPTAKHKTKMWLPERFAELGGLLAKERGATVVVFGGPDDSAYCENIVKRINDLSGENTARNFAGKLSLLETACTMDVCNLIVTNDTGLMHLATARKKPVVAIFGSTVEQFGFFPYRASSIIVECNGLSCRPCSHIGRAECPKGHFRCMNDITVSEVVDATRKLLQ